jgi:hypothetical protein
VPLFEPAGSYILQNSAAILQYIALPEPKIDTFRLQKQNLNKLLKQIIKTIFNAKDFFIMENQTNIDLNIEGMTCEHCARSIEKKLSQLRGVEQAKVHFEQGSRHYF